LETTTVTSTTTTLAPPPLPEASSQPVADLAKKWRHAYNAREAFNVTDLSFKNMQKTYVEMQHEPSGAVFKQYYKHNTVFHVPAEGTDHVCTGMCHRDMMCAIGYMTEDDMKVCLEIDDDEMQRFTTAKTPVELSTDSTLPPETITNVIPIQVETTTSESDLIPSAKLPSPQKEEIVTDGTLSGVAIGFSIVLVLGLAIAGLFLYRRVQRDRFRSQEFLLTDSIFRYDGYSHVDGP
jgi:hypothetical protein